MSKDDVIDDNTDDIDMKGILNQKNKVKDGLVKKKGVMKNKL